MFDSIIYRRRCVCARVNVHTQSVFENDAPLLLSQRQQATALDFVHAVGSRQHSLRDALSRSYRDLFFTGSFFDFARLDFVVDLLVRKLAVGGDFGEGARASGIGFFVDGLFFFGFFRLLLFFFFFFFFFWLFFDGGGGVGGGGR